MAQLTSKIKQYVGSEVDFTKDVILMDNSDGKGAFIAEWNLSIAKPTQEQLDALEAQATTYENNEKIKATRKSLYGSIEQQIEYITENGIEAWQTKVQQIKTDNPKE